MVVLWKSESLQQYLLNEIPSLTCHYSPSIGTYHDREPFRDRIRVSLIYLTTFSHRFFKSDSKMVIMKI